jgi:hypothetical protein
VAQAENASMVRRTRHTRFSPVMRRAVKWVAALVLVALVFVVAVLLWHADRRGDLYAFNSATGALRWHSRFRGVDPLVSITGGIVEVDATVGSGCAPGSPVATRFDGRTGRTVHEDTKLPELQEGTAPAVSVEHGVVRVQGQRWRAHVIDRGQPVGVEATGTRLGYVYVAVGGTWEAPCNE